MTQDQLLAFAIVVGMMGLFVWGRFRFDLVAMLALLAAVAVGIVPAENAFVGFGNEIVIIVGSALVVSSAVARSAVAERLLRPVAPYLTTAPRQIAVLVTTVALLSAFMKNVGAMAILMPVAFQLARRTGVSASYLLMPLAFGSLLGGTMTLIGTSPNVIVSRMRTELVGEPFRMFDFFPVGLGLSLIGILFLSFGYRLLPGGRRGAASLDAAFNLEGYATEVLLPADSPMVGRTVAELEQLGDDEARVTTIIRERFRRAVPARDWTLNAEDTLILEGEPTALERVIARGRLKLASAAGNQDLPPAESEMGIMEAVVTADSPLVDRSPAQLDLRGRYQVSLMGVSRSGERVTQRLRSLKFRAGDVIALHGPMAILPERLGELRCLPLATREMPLGRGGQNLVPVAVLAVAMLLVALQVTTVAVAFFGAATCLVLLRTISLREAYDAVDWPILVLLGALIPVSEAIRTTGATEVIAGWLAIAADLLPPLGALALILLAAMAVTPFLNNAATVLVMAPIAASLARKLGLSPDPFLMAVALGAASDFLTPIGHQCNTLVMGPGGYRFGDYWRLGLPLSILVLVVGVPLVALVWPLRPG